jgi:hypothetical protein
MALHVSSTCQREYIAQSIIYTLCGRLFLVAPSLEKGRTSFRETQSLLHQRAHVNMALCLLSNCAACAFW